MANEQQVQNQARELIRKTGHRITKPRLETLIALLSTPQALTHRELRALMPDMDRVSLYRSLEWLIEQNLAFRIDTDGQHRYNADAHEHEDHEHPHFCCTDCGMTTCLDTDKPTNISVPGGFKVSEIKLLVKGLCKDCAPSQDD